MEEYFEQLENYENSIICHDCGEQMSFRRTVSNGEVWYCKYCDIEHVTPNRPNEDNF